MANGQLFHCITAPCGSGTGAPGNPFVPFSSSPGTSARLGFGSPILGNIGFSPAIDQALLATPATIAALADLAVDTFRDDGSDDETALPPDIGGELPVALPPPVRVPTPPTTDVIGTISPEELASIDEALRVAEESERPIVRVTEAERDQFLRDRDSILARTGRDPESLPPNLNPLLIVTDLAKPKKTPKPPLDTPVVQTPAIGPPVFLGDLAEVTGEVEPDPRPDRFEEEPMADLSDIFGALGDVVVGGIRGSLDADPRTPGIFGDIFGPSLPDLVGDAFRGATPQTTPAPRSTPVQVNIDPVTGAVTRCKPRRRRRRLLTKSDIADISTMAALLGKNSESFKVWLAKATR